MEEEAGKKGVDLVRKEKAVAVEVQISWEDEVFSFRKRMAPAA